MLDKTNRELVPEKKLYDDGLVLSKSVNQITLINTDKEIDSKENCVKVTSVQCNSRIEYFLESNIVTLTMSIVTLYALFASDVQVLAFPKSADDIFSSLVVTCLILFFLELLLSYLYKPGYRWSFYFWLDLIATLSLITDIGWIWNNLIGVSNTSSNGKQLQNAAKASRAGTRTSRVLRIIRLIRLIRLVKLYKNAQIALKNNEEDENLVNDLNVENLNKETKVGKQLSELTMKRVIIIVLLLLFILPLFDTDFYYTQNTSWQSGVNLINAYINDHSFEDVKNEYVAYHVNDIRPLSYLSWTNNSGSYSWQGNTDYNDLRYNELYYYSIGNVISITDIRYDARIESLLNIMKTVFICIVLTFGAIFFTRDAEELVIRPIERIIDKVKKIANNPLAASEIKTLNLDNEIRYKKKCFCFNTNELEGLKENYETKIIEDTIIKIGILLAIGFGEAGASIICQNIEKHGKIDSNKTGSKIVGIFGFCDIRNFTDTTEELQEGVMMFVNEIAQIIHGVVGKYFGSANKNIGDAFLMVWKFHSNEVYVEDSYVIRNPESLRAFYIPDLALLSFLKILSKINKDPVILKYRSNQKLLQRMPNYEVKLGFGMHLGWAIEGPIGSDFKIDASYLSPHVNLASALEASTKQYGVPILISGSLYEMLSHKVQKYCRKLDVVKIKGMSSPISIYTSDCDFSLLKQGKLVARKKDLYKKKSANLKKKLNKDHLECAKLFEDSQEIQIIRHCFDENFFKIFEQGIEAYINGRWGEAKEKLSKAREIRADDGPSKAILNFMSDFNYMAPRDWQKSRYLE